jgi:RNA polymerase sigma-70 factor (ECF subfamily)
MRDAYDECLRVAAGCSRNRHDVGDLVQTVFLHAIERGIADLAASERQAWLRGALRRRAAFEGRLAARGRRREALWSDARAEGDKPVQQWRFSAWFLARLQPSVRVLATLASADLSPAEIRSVLSLGGTAFRKRLSLLRRFVREASNTGRAVVTPGGATYALGPARVDVIESLRRRPQAVLGSHDPDGHPLIFAVHGRESARK